MNPRSRRLRRPVVVAEEASHVAGVRRDAGVRRTAQVILDHCNNSPDPAVLVHALDMDQCHDWKHHNVREGHHGAYHCRRSV